MADQEAVAVESAAPAEVQTQAEAMGWIPPSRFKGDPERFVDADEFIKRGEVVLPIVKAKLRETESRLAASDARATRVEAALAAAQKSLEEIELRNSVATQKAVEQAKADVKRQLASASEAGDHEAVAALTEQMVELNTAPAPKAAEKKEVTAEKPAELPADLVQWNKDNPWFGTNKRKTALALGIAQELRDNGETAVGGAFFKLVSAEMDKEYGTTEAPAADKVAAGRHSEDGSGRSGGGKTYNHLPAEAKAACDADAKRFVGPGKRYEKISDWRSDYANLYFS